MNPEKRSWIRISLILVVLLPGLIGEGIFIYDYLHNDKAVWWEAFFLPFLCIGFAGLLWIVPYAAVMSDLNKREYLEWSRKRSFGIPDRDYSKPIPALSDDLLNWPGKSEGKPKPRIIWLKDRKAPG